MGDAWRLILSPPDVGAWNMALDEAILEATSRKSSPPTLRLYAWSPPCLSLGNSQPISQIDLKHLADVGWDIVRRSTGGRAILHTDELTYSVCAPIDHPQVQGGVLPSYRNISRGITAGLKSFGLDVEVQPEITLSEEERADPICFEQPSSYEITVDGKKLAGSAQLRRRGGVLQHGTIPLYGDIGRICQVLAYPNEIQRQRAMHRLRARATTLEQLLGRHVKWDEAASAIAHGFRTALEIQLESAEATQDEKSRAEEIRAKRHEGAEWLERV